MSSSNFIYIRKIIPPIVVISIAVYFAMRIDWRIAAAAVRQVSWSALLVAVALNTVAAVSVMTLQYGCLRGPRKAGMWRAEDINARVLALSVFFPTAIVAAFKVAAYKDLFRSFSKAIAFFAIGKASSLLVASFAVLVVISQNGMLEELFSAVDPRSVSKLTLFSLCAAGLLLMMLFSWDSARNWGRSFLHKILSGASKEWLIELRASFTVHAIAAGLMVQLISFVLTVFAANMLATALSTGIPIQALIMGRGLTLLALVLPISIAGIGAREVSFLAVLALFGVDRNLSGALVMLLLLTQWGAGLAGLVYSCFLRLLVIRGL